MASDRTFITLERLKEVAASLRSMEQVVLVLSARDHLSSDEIAARLGISVRKAERLLARAVLKLDRAIDRSERAWWKSW